MRLLLSMLVSLVSIPAARAEDVPASPLYISMRLGVGYGAFEREAYSEGSGTTVSWPEASLSGFMFGLGATLAWPIGADLYLGPTLSFDPLVASTGSTDDNGDPTVEDALTLNGTGGVALVWTASSTFTGELAVVIGGGGHPGASAGGFGVHLQANARIGTFALDDGTTFGPQVRLTYAPIMSGEGGDTTFASIDVGLSFRFR